MSNKVEFNSIEEILDDLRQGKIVVILDDEDRENEGDVICAAEFATTENVTLWQATPRDLSVCLWHQSTQTDLIFHRCVSQILITIAPHFLCQ